MRISGVCARIIQCLLALSLVTVLAGSALAQSTTEGAIRGTVYDASGKVVPNATVTVKNNGTNATQTVTTDASGYFRIPQLRPAEYTVTITATGFTTYSASPVTVQVGTSTELSPHLQVGGITTTVEVTSELPQVNTSTMDFAPVVNQVAIQNLPINGGRWSDFALMTPGVVNDASGFGLLSFRGISTLLNNNTIDGADNNQAFFSEERGRTRAGYSSAKAAVQEFQVNTSNYSAEYGRSAGGVVNTVSKSGSNTLHGEAYINDRDNAWGSMNPFTLLTQQTSPGIFQSLPYKPEDVRKIGGFAIGGPIIKDKLFFFLAWDDYHRNFPGTSLPGSPAAFYATPQADLTNFGGSCSSLNTASFSSLTNGSNILTATQGACNLMTRLGLADYPTAVAKYNAGLAGLLSETGPVPRTGDQNILFPKIDWTINSKNHASFELNRMRWDSPAGIQTQATNTYAIDSFGNDYVKDTWFVGQISSSLTTNLLNEARYQWGRDFEYEFAQNPTAYEQQNFINPTGYSNPLGLAPDIYITNGFDMGVATFLQRPHYPDERRQQFADTMTWMHGKHSLKYGVDYTHVNDFSENLIYQYGYYSFSSIGNFLTDLYAPQYGKQNVGCSGKPCWSSYTQSFGPLGSNFNTNDVAFFIEDQWKIHPRLTVNLGLRYEYEMLPDPISTLVNPAVPQTGQFPHDKNNLGPRIGIAWDLTGDGKTALRAGYGIYYGRIINSTIYNALLNTGMPGGQLTYSFTTSTAGLPTFPQIVASAAVAGKPNIVYFDNGFQAPTVHEMDLTLERDLGWNTVLSISYLGSLGRNLPDFVDQNLATSSSLTYTIVGSAGPLPFGTTFSTPLYNTRPNSSYGSMTNIFSGVSSNYNAVAVQLNRRMAEHLQFQFNYTHARALDYGENAQTFTTVNALLVPNNIQVEYGPSIFDVPHRFVFNAVIDAPWKFCGWQSYLLNGWQVAPIFQAQSGLPYSLVTSGTAGFGGVNGSNGRKGLPIIGRNSFRYPRLEDADLRITKKINFGERYSLELRGEAFNLFNRINVTNLNNTGYIIATSGTYTNPGGGASVVCSSASPCLNYNAPFGTVTSANSNFAWSTRQIQIGLRFVF